MLTHFFSSLRFSKKRLLCLVATLAAIPLWHFSILPNILKLPADFEYQSDMISVDNFYDVETEEYSGEKYSNTLFSYSVTGQIDNTLLIKSSFHVQTQTGETIYQSEPIYAIDRTTGAHVPTVGDTARTGYLFGPRWLKKDTSFQYWHPNSTIPLNMTYQGEERINGLLVYKYASNPEDVIDQTSALSFLPEVGETKGIRLSSLNIIWVEPITGHLVKQQDYSLDYYYYDLATGERLTPYNKFLNTFTEESTAQHTEQAKRLRLITLGLAITVPSLLIVLAVFILADAHIGFAAYLRKKKRFLASLILLMCMLTAIIGAYLMLRDILAAKLNTELADDADEIENLIQKRFDVYDNALLSAKAFLAASEFVNRDEWRTYAEVLSLTEALPGMQGLGFSQVVAPDDVAQFTESVRAEGFPNFSITPDYPRDFYTTILYLEPFNERNQRAFGYDMFTDPIRRVAMRQARDSGNLVASGEVRLLQEKEDESQSGFLVYLPIYRHGTSPMTAEERIEQLTGFVFAPFRINDMIESIVEFDDFEVDFKIFDGLQPTPESLIFTSNPTDTANQNDTFFQTRRVIYINEHAWTIEYFNKPTAANSPLERALPNAMLLGGTLLCLLIFLIVRSYSLADLKAQKYAQTLTQDLQNNKKLLETRNDSLAEKLQELDSINKMMVDRELKMAELKERLKRYE